ncbi:MAG: CHASE2 domain-containing protein [Rhizobiales bacterium]|nr:CHASE2 domain-containing protein [Hyphomicrobiales bacterium]
MTSRQTDRYAISIAGLICLVVALAFLAFDPGALIARTREAVFDRLLPLASRPAESGRIAVVEIDRSALMTHGNWPWPRDRLAVLVEKIVEAKPALVAVEILLPENTDGNSASSDARLAQALARVPSVLAIVLDPELTSEPPPAVPLAVAGNIDLHDLVVMPGAVLPSAALRASAQGLGIVSLPVPEGEPVRRVFLLAGGGTSLLSGFPVEALRVAAGNATMIASGPPQVLRIGETAAPVSSDGQMRILFSSPGLREKRTTTASAVFTALKPLAELKDKIVLLGVSAPEAGGLRLTAVDPFLPSIQIEADAIETILGGRVPSRPAWSPLLESVIALLMGLAGVAAVSLASIGRSAALAIMPPLAWAGGTAAAALGTLQLLDPVAPLPWQASARSEPPPCAIAATACAVRPSRGASHCISRRKSCAASAITRTN